MTKAESLDHWRALSPGQNPLSHMAPIPYNTAGGRYGCDGIRIDGSPAFIDAVLSRLQSLLDGENCVTRLELARHAVKVQPGYKSGQNAGKGAEVCYVRLHMRSTQGSAVSSFFDRGLHGATERYAETVQA